MNKDLSVALIKHLGDTCDDPVEIQKECNRIIAEFLVHDGHLDLVLAQLNAYKATLIRVEALAQAE